MQKKKYGDSSQTQLYCLCFKIKKNGMIQNSIFIHSDMRQTKADKPLENETKKVYTQMK